MAQRSSVGRILTSKPHEPPTPSVALASAPPPIAAGARGSIKGAVPVARAPIATRATRLAPSPWPCCRHPSAPRATTGPRPRPCRRPLPPRRATGGEACASLRPAPAQALPPRRSPVPPPPTGGGMRSLIPCVSVALLLGFIRRSTSKGWIDVSCVPSQLLHSVMQFMLLI